MQQNQVYVIQVNAKNKAPLALPAPGPGGGGGGGALLPSEVKYSASLVRGLGYTHIVLGAVLFMLGVLGSWVEPETCWAGAGIWGGIATVGCGICGLLAYHLWYKNYTIKAFLVSSVVCVVISILAIILTIYALVNRHEHYFYLVEQAEKLPWFRPYNANQEKQLTLSVSANQLVGFILELILALWSVRIGWRGVRAEEFSSSRRNAIAEDELQSVISVPHHNGQQIPLAALYQLIQAHPELLGSKNMGGGIGPPWLPSLDDRPSHQSMDYQERVSRFLSHAIEDHNTSFSRSPSVLQGDLQDNPSPTRSSSVTGSGGRGSPSGGSAETIVLSQDPSGEVIQTARVEDSSKRRAAVVEELVPEEISDKPIKLPAPKIKEESVQRETADKPKKSQAPKHKSETEPKGKAPIPKDVKQMKERKDEHTQKVDTDKCTIREITEDKTDKKSVEREKGNKKETEKDNKKETERDKKSETKEQASVVEEETSKHTKTSEDKSSTKSKESRKSNKTEKHKSKKEKLGKISEEKADDTTENKDLDVTDKKQHSKEKSQDEAEALNNDKNSREPSSSSSSDKVKKSKKSKREKNTAESSKRTEVSEGSKNTSEKQNSVIENNEDDRSVRQDIQTVEDNKLLKEIAEQLVDIKPPTEFQDSESTVSS